MFKIWGLNAVVAFMTTVPLQLPPLTQPVVDSAHILQPDTVMRLNAALSRFAAAEKAQIAVLTVAKLNGEVLENFSLAVVEKWQLGKNKQDNGVLLLLAMAERHARLEVGYGLEGTLPDAQCAQIINTILKPAFAEGHYDDGVTQTLQAVVQAIDPNWQWPASLQPSAQHNRRPAPDAGGEIGKLLLVLVILWFMFGGGRRGRGQSSLLPWFIFDAFLSGRSSRRDGNDDDDFRGGGGRFGGGGAQGGW